MTNNDKLHAIKELVLKAISSTSDAAYEGNISSAKWIYLKGQLDAFETIRKGVNEIMNQ